MRNVFMLCVILFSVGCGGKDGEGCTVSKVGDTTTIMCGDEGVTITDGKNGKNGRDGANGTDNTIIGSIHCYGHLSTSLDIVVLYNVDQFASKDLFVSACVEYASFSQCNAVMYSSQQVGYTHAPIMISTDGYGIANFGYYIVSLDRVTKIVTVEYKDSALSSALSWTKPASECIVNEY